MRSASTTYGSPVATPYDDLRLVDKRYGTFSYTESYAWATITGCPKCKGTQAAVLAMNNAAPRSVWLRCVTCGQPMVSHDGVLSPSTAPLTTPGGVRGEELAAWTEARQCLGVGAYTASVMMCRKLLLHVAVAQGLAAKDAKGRAPSFMDAVNHLQDEGVITKRMRPWIDRIKDVGNEANHEIKPIDEATALDVAAFTEQLLRLTYEMDALVERGGAAAITGAV